MTSINIYANLTRVSRIFSLFQLCIGWAERELQENFEKDAPFYRSLCIDLPPPLRFSLRGGGGGGPEQRLFYEGDQKLQKVMNTIMNTEIMNTFTKTFVQDCSYFYHHFFLPPMFTS